MAVTYSTNEEAAGEFKSLTISVSGVVTPTNLDQWRDEAFAEINAKVGTRYATPIASADSPESFKILRSIELGLLKDRIREKIRIATGAGNFSQTERDPLSAKISRAQLKEIQDGVYPLADAVPLSRGQGVKSFNSSHGETHTFKKNKDQW